MLRAPPSGREVATRPAGDRVLTVRQDRTLISSNQFPSASEIGASRWGIDEVLVSTIGRRYRYAAVVARRGRCGGGIPSAAPRLPPRVGKAVPGAKASGALRAGSKSSYNSDRQKASTPLDLSPDSAPRHGTGRRNAAMPDAATPRPGRTAACPGSTRRASPPDHARAVPDLGGGPAGGGGQNASGAVALSPSG